MKPCETFGPARATEIQTLIAVATGIPCCDRICEHCPLGAMREKGDPELTLVAG